MNIAIILTFALMGIIFGSLAIMMTMGAKTKKGKIASIVFCVVAWLVFSFALYGEGMAKNNVWNDGYCECGTHWELAGATRTKSGQTIKYYSCPNCYAEIEQ